MAAMADGTAHDLHGAQVGVASIVTAALWEIALDELSLGALDPWTLRHRTTCASGRRLLGRPGPDRPARRRVLGRGGAQVRRVGGAPGGTTRFLCGWGAHEETLRRYAYPPEVPARALHRWGAPLRFADLTPAVDPAAGAVGAGLPAVHARPLHPAPTCCCWPAAGPTSSSSASSTGPPAPAAACESRRPTISRPSGPRPLFLLPTVSEVYA